MQGAVFNAKTETLAKSLGKASLIFGLLSARCDGLNWGWPDGGEKNSDQLLFLESVCSIRLEPQAPNRLGNRSRLCRPLHYPDIPSWKEHHHRSGNQNKIDYLKQYPRSNRQKMISYSWTVSAVTMLIRRVRKYMKTSQAARKSISFQHCFVHRFA